jgi:hypothetical protein
VAGSSAIRHARSSWRLPEVVSIFPSRRSALRLTSPYLYQYNLSIPWEIDCRIEARGLIPAAQPVTCEAVRGHHPDEDLAGPPLGLINFNNDGLASKYSRQHRVINVHGTGV